MEQQNKNNECGGQKAECAARNSESEKKRVYISGPISGYDMEERHEAFGRVAEMLKDLGYLPISPMNNGLPDDSSREEHMMVDLAMLMTCEYIYQMRGWTESKGAVLETLVARQRRDQPGFALCYGAPDKSLCFPPYVSTSRRRHARPQDLQPGGAGKLVDKHGLRLISPRRCAGLTGR